MNFNELFNKIKAIDSGENIAIAKEAVDQSDDETYIPGQLDNVEEGVMSEVDQILQDVAAGRLDAYEIMSNPRTPAEKGASQIIQDMYETVAIDHHLHPDDDFEQILDIVADNLAQDYGTDESVAEGDYGWDDPSQEPSRPEPDEDWEYEKRRQHEIDHPNSAPNFKYEPSEDELAAEKEEQSRKNDELKRVLAMMDKMYGAPKKREAVGESLTECGMSSPMEQQDSVTMNVSMNGSGANGIRDLLNILKNMQDGTDEPEFKIPVSNDPDSHNKELLGDEIEDEGIVGQGVGGAVGGAAGAALGAVGGPLGSIAGDIAGSAVGSVIGDKITGEEFANSPDEVYGDISDVTTSGNDLHRAKDSYSSRPYRGDNPMAHQPRLEALYRKIKGE